MTTVQSLNFPQRLLYILLVAAVVGTLATLLSQHLLSQVAHLQATQLLGIGAVVAGGILLTFRFNVIQNTFWVTLAITSALLLTATPTTAQAHLHSLVIPGILAGVVLRRIQGLVALAVITLAITLLSYQLSQHASLAQLINVLVPAYIILLLGFLAGWFTGQAYWHQQKQLVLTQQEMKKQMDYLREQSVLITEIKEELAAAEENARHSTARREISFIKLRQALEHLSHTNAHQVRAPLARILGLLSIMRTDQQTCIDFLSMLEHEAHDLDQVIRNFGTALYELQEQKQEMEVI